VTFDDANFISYLSSALKEVESKVDDIVYQWELDRVQKSQFEKIVEKNQHLIQKMKMEADEMAEAEVKKLSQKAKKNLKDN
jgi:hypothetical protein